MTSTQKLTSCRCCSSDKINRILTFPSIPLVGEFTKEPNSQALRRDLNLYFCSSCSVLLIDEAIDSDLLFNQYAFSSSTVASLKNHFNEYAKWIKLRYDPKSVLEVGCNDGILLGPLKNLSVESFGVDISENITKLARNLGHNVQNIKFQKSAISILRNWIGREVDIITASNTFPHNSDPNDFLQAAYELLTDEGRIILEVMYSGSMSENLQWDTIYHEHLHFHSLVSITQLLNSNGFNVEHAELSNMHAGSLRVVGSKKFTISNRETQEIYRKEQILELNTLNNWINFSQKSFNAISDIRSNLINLRNLGEVVAYGASGRASMWIHVAKLEFIKYVIDGSPLRSGHYMPGTDIEIKTPAFFEEDKPFATFITAWNYADGIMNQHPNYTGTWIIPLPRYREVTSK
jgi:SAM-dependent methyltransferase